MVYGSYIKFRINPTVGSGSQIIPISYSTYLQQTYEYIMILFACHVVCQELIYSIYAILYYCHFREEKLSQVLPKV